MITGGVILAALAWFFSFALEWGNFWYKICGSVCLVVAYSLIFQRPRFRFRWKSLWLGLGSAALLYGIFWLGHQIAPLLIPGAKGHVGGIYDMGTGTPPYLIFMLLLLITGPGEEIFWRSFLQDRLMDRWGKPAGFIAATLLYGSVHIVALNPMLFLAALVAGAFWGAIYAWNRDLMLVTVSHAIWSAVIFGIFPIR
ncbi:MAG TPA: type II CAAX endopeptidase family protein [Thermoanaerobaculia bacterium]|nr:type II CAAX endopeptidase family protein [Thermoanaerobaculia bacterium]HUM29887.1 type II CAAX endopeptidase family protein [Thermoanaerobaculia bacterium]HXK68246.1 type II CAAX endopeptidase family protein [Thermoanaerobaculia bacterium]